MSYCGRVCQRALMRIGGGHDGGYSKCAGAVNA